MFQAVVNSFVAGDKAKRRMVDERNRQGMTYTDVTTNLQASYNVDQWVLLQKERVVNVSNPQQTVHKFVEANAKGTHVSFLNIVEVRAHV